MGGCAVGLTPYTGGNTAHGDIVASGTAGRAGNPSVGGSGINMFTDPQAVYQNFRPMILGVDGRFGGMLRGFPGWNLDAAVRKTFRFRESMGATLSFEFINVLNHFQPGNPSLERLRRGELGRCHQSGQRAAQNRIWIESLLLMTGTEPRQSWSATQVARQQTTPRPTDPRQSWSDLFLKTFACLLFALTANAEDLFTEKLYPIFEKAQCRLCHNDNGVASGTRLRFPG